MARERIFTRTIISNEMELTLYNKATKSTAITRITTPAFKTVKELEKYLDSHYNDGEIRWVEYSDIIQHKDLYGISEYDFLKYAVKIEKNTNKEDN